MKTIQKVKSREFIRPLKRIPKVYGEKHFFVFDVETKIENDTHNFVFAYALEYRPSKKKFNDLNEKIKRCSKYHFFKSREELTKFLFAINVKGGKKKKTTRTIFAHNLEYDIKFLRFDIVKKAGFELKKFMINPTYLVFVDKKRDLRITFIDTFNFYKTSLEKLFPNEKVSIDFEKYDYKDLSILKKRCKVDVFLTAKLVHDLKGVSASDLSFKIFRESNVYVQKIETPLAKNSYYGGRVECYVNNLRIPNINYYDFNSLYPSVMKGNIFPIKYVQTIENPSIEFVKEVIKRNFFVFAEVEVNIPEDINIPPFPFKGEDNKLYFPVGKFKTVLAQPEIMLGLEKGFIEKFYKIEIYYAKEIFTDFVKKYYSLRQQNPGRKEYYKLILNSLYGKFGQREHETKLIQVEETDFIGDFEMEGEKYYVFNGYGFKTKVLEKRKYNVAIASAVSSYARVKLYKMMEKAKFNVVYCDTDSIFTTEILPTSEKLGDLKLECSGEFLGFRAKCYIIKDKVKFKGAKVSLNLLNKLPEKVVIELNKFPTLREYIKNKGVIKNVKVIKEFDLNDDKRKGKGVTKPYKVEELIRRWGKNGKC